MKFLHTAFLNPDEAHSFTPEEVEDFKTPFKIRSFLELENAVLETRVDMTSLSPTEKEQLEEHKDASQRALAVLLTMEHQEFLKSWCETALERVSKYGIVRKDTPAFIRNALGEKQALMEDPYDVVHFCI